ncbi:BZ3500_MvSof-1268-A1-R1_Chr1-3g02119 [Microbotryum saponariae]|uniref:BZ3500_MvSof-1268-A1-R1_Chr1-3g02119 protein n=1 Tax=Microbotryum saponariae TaxID=289078 RepID=A0A2X0KUI7_9BASI|nr:BZ3500_MvSof-1268-A1-R1_Chr1-3g02119 [Microbotryum saponariae]SCZ95436.1 BZ3501_MvSof-1269-A2-R1_Chr1-3g01721 [Microbotryum saponariae]
MRHLVTPTPLVINDLFKFKFPIQTYELRSQGFFPWFPRNGDPSQSRWHPGFAPPIPRNVRVAPSHLLYPRLRRFPGEVLPLFPLMSAVLDPSLLDRVGCSFRDGLMRSGRHVNEDLPPSASQFLSRFRQDKIRVGIEGQPGDHQFALWRVDGEECIINVKPVETNAIAASRMVHDKLVLPKYWLDFASREPIDIRILEPDGRLKERLEGDAYMMLALQMLFTGSRFGLFYCAPDFVLAELAVDDDGRTHMLFSPLYSSAWVATDDVGPVAAETGNFLATLVSLFMSHHPNYSIKGPSDETRAALRAITDKLEQNDGKSTPPKPRSSDLDNTVSTLFVRTDETVVSVRHHFDRKIITGVASKPRSDLVAIGVDLDCTTQSKPALLIDFHTDHCGLDRLDLVTKVGNGCTAMAWTARWNRAGAEAASDRFTCSPLLTGEREVPLVAKVVSARYAASIAREYFVHKRIIPLLSPAARAFIPQFHGFYRTGSPDGYAYVFFFENAGAAIREEEWDANEELRDQAKAAFRLIGGEGLVHGDPRSPNVVRSADGQIFLIDWGEAHVTHKLVRLRADFPDISGVIASRRNGNSNPEITFATVVLCGITPRPTNDAPALTRVAHADASSCRRLDGAKPTT